MQDWKAFFKNDIFAAKAGIVLEEVAPGSARAKLEIGKRHLNAGGVSCSQYMRNFLVEHMYKDLNIVFGKPEMSADNAIGVALLGGQNIWR